MQWSQNAYYPQPDNLQFYQDYPGSRPSLDGTLATQQHIPQHPAPHTYAGNIQSVGGWWTAFGTGGFEGEPPLLEGTMVCTPSGTSSPIPHLELGINFSHIRAKSLTVLNPLQGVDARIMDDADMAGPIIFLFCFGTCLLLVSPSPTLCQSEPVPRRPTVG